MKTKIINQIKGIAANTVLAVLIAGCTAPEEQPEEKKLIVETLPAIQPPFAELIPAFNEYAVDATKGDTIVITSGTRIIIPPNAMVDDSGNVVTGKAKIKYREYHDALDIFLSGIPMEYTENGQKEYFQTAGMFEIIAEQNAKELKIAESKTIKVEFASFQPGDEYNFYFFNKNKKKWEYENNIKPKENPKRALIKKEIRKLRPKFKIPFDDSHFVFDYTSLLDVDLNNENFS
ncbi:MAG: hypothetical protein FVQ77_13965, partial [Cytophagales bacterium]|nr:hypothetical protein [Cytophagales bacterium]